MVDVKITEKSENAILKRFEIAFEIDHFGGGTPERIEVKEKLAALETADPNLTFIKKIEPVYGLPKAKGFAYIYKDKEIAERLEPAFVRIRNVPKDQRKELKEALKKK